MKVVLYMAQSLNGIIARKDNQEDFLTNENWQMLCKLVREHKALIWGRKTYELVREWGEEYFPAEMKRATKVIISRQKDIQLDKGYVSASSPEEALELLKRKGLKSVVLTGGSTINSLFVRKKLIDEVIINIEPVLVGEGIPLVAETNVDLRLKLKGSTRLSQDIVQLSYLVCK